MKSHDEHLIWAKARAHEYLDRGDKISAMISMLSDLQKHPDWQDGKLITTIFQLWMLDQSIENTGQLIDGFH
jgi:NADH:ubiquinone oxidoreductase subunit E